jgi:transcriptional regulator with XRE-family HTH domain
MTKIKLLPEVFVRLRPLRKAWCLTQKEMAIRAGIAVSTYQYYERGTKNIPSEVLSLLTTFGVSAEWLLTGKGEMFQSQKEKEFSLKVDQGLLQQVIEDVEELLAEDHLILPANKKARLLSLLYQLFDETEKKVSKKTVKEYIRLVA